MSLPKAGRVDDSFFSLTPERVLAAVETGGRRATGYVMALNSLENRVYEVELEDAEATGSATPRVVAKFYRPGRWSRDALLDEHSFLAELAEAELPVVPPIAREDGATLRALDPPAPGEPDGPTIQVALFPKVRGRAPEELTDEQLAQLGRLLARLHQIGGRRTAPHRPFLTPATYGTASIALLASGPWIPLELLSSWRRVAESLVVACQRAFDATPSETIRLHGDCHLGNLLWGAAGPFFLDFDDFLSGPPVQDLWLLAPGQDDEALRQRDLLVGGYESMRVFDRRTLRLVEPLRALRILRYAAWIAQRWTDPAFQRMFPDFEEHKFWQREQQILDELLRRIGSSNDR